MKKLYIVLTFTCIYLFVACKGDNDPDFDCPVGSMVKTTDAGLYSIIDFKNYSSYPIIDGVEHKASYMNKWGLAYFSLFTKINNICPGEPLKIKASLKLYDSDPKMTDSLLINEFADGVLIKSTLNNLPADGNGTIYSVEVPHLFNTGESNNVLFGHCAVFPTLGSYPLDSAYFFYKLAYLKMSSTYKNR